MTPEKKKFASLNPVDMLPEENNSNDISGSDQIVYEPDASKMEADRTRIEGDHLNAEKKTFGEGNHLVMERNFSLPVKRGSLLPQRVINLKQEIQKADWIPHEDKKKNTHFERCHPVIKDNIQFLAQEYSRRQSELGRLALFIGIGSLWTLGHIGEIRKIRAFVHKYSDDQEDREFFSSAKFDGLESAYAKPLHIEFYERDVKQCDGLASELGLNPGTVRQLALMAGLINAKEIPQRDRDQMVGILRKFRQWLDRRVKKAQEIKRIVQERQSSFPQPMENQPTSWNDVLEDR